MAAAIKIWIMHSCLTALTLLLAAALLRLAWRTVHRLYRIGFGIFAFAIAATMFGGNKPEPQPKKEELVVIVEEISDGIYSTHMLHISKESLDEIKNGL